MAYVYCNQHFVPEDQASISIFDRGLLFADAIYEVSAVIGGRMIDNDLHLQRLNRSLGEIGIALPMPLADIEAIQQELISRNALDEGTIYMQVSRGVAKRDFLYADDLKPNLFAFTSARKLTGTKAQTEGVAVMLAPDPRWVRRDIKTVMLLGQVMVKQAARAEGFDDVWLVEDGLITEGASASAFIITHDGAVVTRPNSQAILPGCTRRAVLRLCEEQNIRMEERAFSPDEAYVAAEAFLTSASSFVTPVVRIGEKLVGDGGPGPLTRRLQKIYVDMALDDSGQVACLNRICRALVRRGIGDGHDDELSTASWPHGRAIAHWPAQCHHRRCRCHGRPQNAVRQWSCNGRDSDPSAWW